MSLYVTRQPIFDQALDTVGYELHFRARSAVRDEHAGSTAVPFRPDEDWPLAGNRTLMLTGDPRNLLRALHGPDGMKKTIVALPTSLSVNAEILEATRKLERLGAKIAVDASVAQIESPIRDVASIAQVQVSAVSTEVVQRIQSLSRSGFEVLAMHIPDETVFQALHGLGATYYSGNVLPQAPSPSENTIPTTAMSRLLLMREVFRADMDVDGLAKAISTDVSVSYQLLTRVNSAAAGVSQEITSIKHAVLMLGLRGIRQIVATVLLQEMGSQKPSELVIQSLIRASFCEAVASRGPLFERSNELYLLGLFSMIDTLLDSPMELILPKLPLAPDLKDALLGGTSTVSQILDLVTAYEHAEWSFVDRLADEFAQHEERLATAYRRAVASATALAA